DVAYGAFQRGHYLTAFNEATKRAQQNDPAAMTLLGELYAQGLGVGRDDLKAAQWYKLAAAKGDRDAIFALAIFSFQGRAGPRNIDDAARLLDAAAKLGHPSAAYAAGLRRGQRGRDGGVRDRSIQWRWHGQRRSGCGAPFPEGGAPRQSYR